MKRYQILSHTADLKIKAWGKDLKEIFVNLALGIASQQLGEEARKEKSFKNGQKIELTAPDLESLLVDWLNEVLYLSEKNNCVYLGFKVLKFQKNPPFIEAVIFGQPIKTKNIEIKAATYHDLEIKKINNHWEGVVVLDI